MACNANTKFELKTTVANTMKSTNIFLNFLFNNIITPCIIEYESFE
jgi:hypothetical protein